MVASWAEIGVTFGAIVAIATAVFVVPRACGVLWRLLRGLVRFGDAVPDLLELPARVERMEATVDDTRHEIVAVKADLVHLHDCLHGHAQREETALAEVKAGQDEARTTLAEHLQTAEVAIGELHQHIADDKASFQAVNETVAPLASAVENLVRRLPE